MWPYIKSNLNERYISAVGNNTMSKFKGPKPHDSKTECGAINRFHAIRLCTLIYSCCHILYPEMKYNLR